MTGPLPASPAPDGAPDSASADGTDSGTDGGTDGSEGGAGTGRPGTSVVLIGFMGAGKTTVGRLLAQGLGLPFADSDAVIEQRRGRPVREIFATEGEPAFRELERQVIADLLAGPPVVLSLGGGAVQTEATRRLLAGTGRVVYLRAGFAQVLARIGGDPERPVLHRADVRDVYRARLPLYLEVADVVVDTDDRCVEDVVTRARAQLDPR